MPIIPVADLSRGGVIKDTPTLLLPPNAFTDALNVKFRDGAVQTSKGNARVTDITPTTIAPSRGIFWPRTTNQKMILAEDAACTIYSYSGSNVENQMFAGNPAWVGGEWQFDLFGGGYAAIVNNTKGMPMYCLEGGPGSTDTAFAQFPGWLYGGWTNIVARVVRPFGYSLVAANFIMQKPGVTLRAPVTLRISVQAPIGGFPQIWEPGLTTDTADEFEVNSRSPIQDMLELRGQLFIYSWNSIHVLQLSNGFPVVREYTQGRGCLQLGCVIGFENQHLVVDRTDIYLHNGSGQFQSILQGRMRDFFMEDCNFVQYTRIFLHHDPVEKEVWICYSSMSAPNSYCDKALVYDYVENTLTIRQLPGLRSMTTSRERVSGAYTDRTLELWGLPGGGGGSKYVLQMNTGYTTFNRYTSVSEGYPSYVAKERLSLSNNPFEATSISGIAPVLESIPSSSYDADDTVLTATLQSQNIYDKAVTWSEDPTRSTFTIKPRDEKQGYVLHPRQAGRFLSYKLGSAGAPWKLSFLGLDIKGDQKR